MREVQSGLARFAHRAYPHHPNMIISRSRLISLVLFTAILLAVLVSFSGQPGFVSAIA